MAHNESESPHGESLVEPSNLPALPDNLFLLDPENRSLLKKDSRPFKFLRRTWLVLLLLLSILSVPLLIFMQGFSGLVGEIQLASYSVTTQGEVADHRTGGGGGRGQFPLYFISYRFLVPNQRIPITNEQFVSKETFEKLANGDPVKVTYVPSNPSISKLSGSPTDTALYNDQILMTVIGAIGTLISIALLIFQLRRMLENYRIQSTGQLLIGHINHCKGKLSVTGRSMSTEDYGTALRGNFVIDVDYRFRPANNHEIRQHEVRKRNDLLKSRMPAPNTPIAVFYVDDQHFRAL